MVSSQPEKHRDPREETVAHSMETHHSPASFHFHQLCPLILVFDMTSNQFVEETIIEHSVTLMKLVVCVLCLCVCDITESVRAVAGSPLSGCELCLS